MEDQTEISEKEAEYRTAHHAALALLIPAEERAEYERGVQALVEHNRVWANPDYRTRPASQQPSPPSRVYPVPQRAVNPGLISRVEKGAAPSRRPTPPIEK